MKVLILYAHPEPTSFNGALKEAAVQTLGGAGHEVRVIDLYATGFDPVLKQQDFTAGRLDPARLDISREQTHAVEQGTQAEDVVAAQAALAWSDLLILQFPMWWYGMPAAMKGWFDRVLARGFAYAPGRKYDTGLLAGKLAMVSVTTGTSAATYAPDGIDGDILGVLWPIHNGILRYTGFDVLPPFCAFMPGRVSPAEREAMVAAWRRRLDDIKTTPRLFFHPKDDYGPDERLKPDVLARSGIQRNV